ncbi:hypothetical protein JVU11DRAFT_5905 [Chiua virens]|nr:hypothetical protein JVU11DRAFT_5905 [Chiua virens]
MSDDLENNKEMVAREQDVDTDMSDDLDDDDSEWVDEASGLTAAEQEALEEHIQPIKLALVKLCKLAYKVIHSTTKVLPAWKEIFKQFNKGITLLPHDVVTRWNSTFDMLNYALEHRKEIDMVTQQRDLDLRKFELGDEEWDVLQELCDVLKVCSCPVSRQFEANHGN